MLISVTVEGITPVMFDRFHEGLLIKGAKTTGHGEELTPLEDAEGKLYVDDKGVPVVPADNLLAAIIAAGIYIKVGKRQLSTRDTTIVTSFLSIPELFLPIRSKEGWRVDSRGIVNQSTKGRHMCNRPIFDDWQLDFTLDVDLKEVTEKTVRELIDRAGRQIGVGVMRPQRKGRYGQWKTICWACEVKKEIPQAKPRKVAA
jgi:formyltetrahydrofolate synthetase